MLLVVLTSVANLKYFFIVMLVGMLSLKMSSLKRRRVSLSACVFRHLFSFRVMLLGKIVSIQWSTYVS